MESPQHPGSTDRLSRVIPFAALAVADYEGDAGVYFFYCDPNWNVITDTWHEDVA
jgi:hypothetical protein